MKFPLIGEIFNKKRQGKVELDRIIVLLINNNVAIRVDTLAS